MFDAAIQPSHRVGFVFHFVVVFVVVFVVEIPRVQPVCPKFLDLPARVAVFDAFKTHSFLFWRGPIAPDVKFRGKVV